MLPKNAEFYRLCFIRDQWAYFTTAPVTQRIAEDWDKVPYECNAGSPRYWTAGHDQVPQYNLYCLAFEISNFNRPCDLYHTNSPFSVNRINTGGIPWLSPDTRYYTGPMISIYSSTTLPEFCRIIRECGGMVFLPQGNEDPNYND